MKRSAYITVFLLLITGAFAGPPGTSELFTPDSNVLKLAQKFDKIYYPLFRTTLDGIRKKDYALIDNYFGLISTDIQTDSPEVIRHEAENPVSIVYSYQGVTDTAYNITFPVPWSDHGTKNATWDMYFESLDWLNIYLDSNNPDSVRAAYKVITDWIFSHTEYPNTIEKYAFFDHPCALRMKIILKAYRKNNEEAFYMPGIEKPLLASLLSHLFLTVSLENYSSWNNHGIISDQALLETLRKLPEFKLRDQFIDLAFQRIFQQFDYCFTDDGIHKEHSPCYHVFVNNMFNNTLQLTSLFNYPVPGHMAELKKKTDQYSELVSNYAGFSKIGDCQSFKYIPTGTDKVIKIYPESGWVYVHNPVNEVTFIAQSDFYSFSHYQQDETSFVLNAGGYDLIIDPGLYGYDKTSPYFGYMQSATAHNLLGADNLSFTPDIELTGLSGITRYLMNRHGLAVEMTHPHYEKKGIQTWRQYAYTNENVIVINDSAVAEETHSYSQLFHLAPDAVITENDMNFTISWPDHSYSLEITSNADTFLVIEGQAFPMQGWYFPECYKVLQSSVLVLKKKGKCILIRTKLRVNSVKEKGKKKGKSDDDTDRLISKLGKLDQAMLVHVQPPERWRPARK